ncbi:MAG: hypothetical protein HC866_06580 [Leptolyngbyaceae cyanobacterium RU_5_1]|nr:hypothetical protein [Leptolyngbyaceae cyanobacterium RU_5_1]
MAELEEAATKEPEEAESAESVEDAPKPGADTQNPEPVADVQHLKSLAETQDIDACLNALKTLLSTVEKLQKVRQEIGDIKPLLIRMLDGEVVSGEELEQLKTGVGGLLRLVRAYSDHQMALTNAQPARDLLDQVLKGSGPNHPSG